MPASSSRLVMKMIGSVLGLILAHPLEHFLTRHVRHVPVEHEQIERLSLQTLLQSLAFLERVARVAGGRQRLTDKIRLGRIVIQYSNSHNTPQIQIGSSSPALHVQPAA
jgi:hypothetical protein